jgi:protein TonB
MIISLLIFAGTSLAGSGKKERIAANSNEGVKLTVIDEKKIPEPLPVPERIPEPEPVRTQIFTPPAIVDDENYDKPLSSQDDLINAKIDVTTQAGTDYTGITEPVKPGNNTGIVEDKNEKEPEIFTTVQVPSRFIGDWVKFLRKNLDPDVPVRNNATPGRYTVIIQFVVDKEGN